MERHDESGRELRHSALANKAQQSQIVRFSLVAAILLAMDFSPTIANASSTSAMAYELLNNIGTQANVQDSQSGATTASSSVVNQSFTGTDGNGQTQTMTWSGNTVASSQYGVLKSFTSGTLLNSYYNAANSPLVASDGSIANPSGSPTDLSSLGFASFTDTLQFGGALQSGYTARYIFHIDGTNTGVGAAADLGVNVDADPTSSFFDFGSGPLDTTWATDSFAVNGVTPQLIDVQFSDQAVFDTFNLTDGLDYSSTSAFSSTVTLTGIEIDDQNGNIVNGVTVTSESGTQYNIVTGSQVPEPATIALLGVGLAGLGFSRRKQ